MEDGTSTTALSVSNSMTGCPSETLAPGAIIRRTRSPWEMFSPSSGSLNSPAPGVFEGALDAAGCDGAAATPFEAAGPAGFSFFSFGVGAGAGVAAWLGAAQALASAPSTVKITWPTLILSPSMTRISCTVPLTDEGTSTTALSVSSSMTDCPALTGAPGSTINRTRSPCSMFSPNSGSLNSITAYYSLSRI